MKLTCLLAAALAALCLISCQSDKAVSGETTAEAAAKTPLQSLVGLFTPEPKVPDDALVILACSDLQHSDGYPIKKAGDTPNLKYLLYFSQFEKVLGRGLGKPFSSKKVSPENFISF